MADRRVEQLQLVLGADLLKIASRSRIQLSLGAAVLNVDLVDVVHQLESLISADVLVHSSAEVVCDVVLTVGEGSRAAEAAHDSAGLALDAGLDLVAVYGAFAFFKRAACFKYSDLEIGTLCSEFIRREYTSRTCSDYYDIVIHDCLSPKKLYLRFLVLSHLSYLCRSV